MEDRLTRMLRAQLDLQISAGMDLREMDTPATIAYIKEMTLAATSELHEALDEIGWKTWATSQHINALEAFHELRDVFQFVVNLMFAVTGEFDPESLADMFEASFYDKIAKNHARISDNYSGLEKCPGCKRAMDEIVIHEVHITPRLVRRLCGSCGADLPNAIVTSV